MNSISLQRAIHGFLLAKDSEGKSARTTQWYRHFLLKFEHFLAKAVPGGQVDAVTPEQIREFLKYLREPHPQFSEHRFRREPLQAASAPRTVQGAHTTLSVFFNWCFAEALITRNPIANVKRPRLAKTLVPLFSREDIQALFTACESGHDEAAIARNKAMIMVLLDTGMRLSELMGLRMDKLNVQEGSAQVSGKGAKDRHVFFGVQCKKMLWHYITLFRPPPDERVQEVFLNEDGSAMHARRFQFILTSVGKRANVADVHPHRFRHTAAVQFLRNGGNVFALQKMLGHSSLEMVRYYVELSQDDVKKVHKTASPADNWGLK